MKTMSKPTLILPAYNRPHSLQRLLNALAAADYPPDVRLIISIDAGGENGRLVQQIAHQFEWTHGKKEVIQQEQHRGLIEHIFYCGDLSQTVGDIILLEDDLFVSPMFYHFAAQALDYFAEDGRIAGIALNTLWFNGFTHTPFTPYLDDSDIFFMQIPWYQGQAYSVAQWRRFMEWRATADPQITPTDGLHEMFSQFSSNEWFPFKTKYLAQTNRFYAFPRQSLTTNFGDEGTHFQQRTLFFQVPLQTVRHHFRFCDLDTSTAVYDPFQEMLPTCLNRLTEQLRPYSYTVDLQGTKSLANIRTEYVLTSKKSHAPLFRYGLQMRPLLANVINSIPGQALTFSRTADLDMSRKGEWIREARLAHYYARRRYGRKQRLKQWIGGKVDTLYAKRGRDEEQGR